MSGVFIADSSSGKTRDFDSRIAGSIPASAAKKQEMRAIFKVIVAGGRNFNHFGLLTEKCDYLLLNKPTESIEIVSGGANGADKLGEKYAVMRGISLRQMPAKWNLYGKSAGMRRNEEMADYADALIAFWDGNSHGTENMISIMKERNKYVRVIRY